MSPQRLALLHEDRAWTYAELSADIARVAQVLSGLSVPAGDRVGYPGTNHPALLQTFFAAGLLGAVFVQLNHGLSAPELASSFKTLARWRMTSPSAALSRIYLTA